MPRAQTNGIELEYESFGDPSKPTVLLIMGLGVQMLGWDERFCNMLADRGFHVVRFDNRDIGLSTKIEGGAPPNPLELMAGNYSSASYTLDDMADDTAGLLDALDVDAAHVVGVSMGGMIAQTLACRHPDRVLSLTSIMSSTGSQETGQPKPEVFAALITPTPSDREGYVDAGASLFTLIGSPAYPPDEDELRALIGASYDRCPLPGRLLPPARRDPRLGRPRQGDRRHQGADTGDPRRGRPADRPVRRRGHGDRNPWIEAGHHPRHGARPAARPVATVHRRDRREHRAGERPRCHARRLIAHVDMDAFFVAVEVRRRPELRGKPVVVATGTDPGARGVVMAASYEARKFGVHSALPLATAHRRCPDMVLVPRDMELYREVSGQVMRVLREEVDRVEVVGLDEAYLDLAGSTFPKSDCRRVKHRIREETGLVCSIGLAPNKLLAKIASDLDKPDGFFVLTPERMLDAVGDRPAALIPGVGPKTAERLRQAGVRTVGDLAGADPAVLGRAVGPRLGAELQARANGVDERTVETERQPKSESAEITFAQDVSDTDVLHETLDRLAARVCEGLGRSGYRGRTVTVKVRLRPFRTFTRSQTLEAPTRDAALVAPLARELLGRVEMDAPVRLVGVGLSGLEREAPREEGERLFSEA